MEIHPRAASFSDKFQHADSPDPFCAITRSITFALVCGVREDQTSTDVDGARARGRNTSDVGISPVISIPRVRSLTRAVSGWFNPLDRDAVGGRCNALAGDPSGIRPAQTPCLHSRRLARPRSSSNAKVRAPTTPTDSANTARRSPDPHPAARRPKAPTPGKHPKPPPHDRPASKTRRELTTAMPPRRPASPKPPLGRSASGHDVAME